jgi:phenylalanine-4-hydroxylase
VAQDRSAHELGFDLTGVPRTGYYIDDFQPSCFVGDSFEDRLELLKDKDILDLIDEVWSGSTLTPFEIIAGRQSDPKRDGRLLVGISEDQEEPEMRYFPAWP